MDLTSMLNPCRETGAPGHQSQSPVAPASPVWTSTYLGSVSSSRTPTSTATVPPSIWLPAEFGFDPVTTYYHTMDSSSCRMTADTDTGLSLTLTVDRNRASRAAGEKGTKNASASARSRRRRKEKEQNLETTIQILEEQQKNFLTTIKILEEKQKDYLNTLRSLEEKQMHLLKTIHLLEQERASYCEQGHFANDRTTSPKQ